LGSILISKHPLFPEVEFSYTLSPKEGYFQTENSLDAKTCVPAGTYEIESRTLVGKLSVVQVEEGKDKDISTQVWPQVGLLVLKGGDASTKFKVYDAVTDEPLSLQDVEGASVWFVPGKYRIVMTQPYPGLTFNDVEINANVKKELELQSP